MSKGKVITIMVRPGSLSFSRVDGGKANFRKFCGRIERALNSPDLGKFTFRRTSTSYSFNRNIGPRTGFQLVESLREAFQGETEWGEVRVASQLCTKKRVVGYPLLKEARRDPEFNREFKRYVEALRRRIKAKGL